MLNNEVVRASLAYLGNGIQIYKLKKLHYPKKLGL